MALDALKIQELPSLRSPILVAAFAGWPDAAEVASGTARFLARKLRARRFAEIDPEEFYVFTESRPNTLILAPGQRALEWPANEFFSWHNPNGERDIVILQGREPNLNWREYVDIIIDLAGRLGVTQMIALGGTYDAVSHRGQVSMSGHATSPELRDALAEFGITASSYEGPSSVQSALLEACREKNLLAASLWGHAPHYVRAAPNPKVSHAMLRVLKTLLGVELDLTELEVAGEALEAKVDAAMLENPELRDYVEQLDIVEEPVREQTVEELMADLPLSRPDPAEIMRELEEILKQRQPDGDPDRPPDSPN
ncbi:MAG TPA: PAC2 family protein [Chloroflexota bacterium]|nr:PAC2 family protein [Chloroflexota bacterium]